MEYLVTYGWAILIIAVVLVVLFSLGVFNPTTYLARQSPGACQVYRPFGVDTVQQINLQGFCGTSIPKFVAFFNGKNSEIDIPNQSAALIQPSGLTITAWIYTNTSQESQAVLSKASTVNDIGYVFPETTTGWNTIAFSLFAGGSWHTITATYPAPDAWHFVAATYNGEVMDIYIDGSLASSTPQSGALSYDYDNLTIGNNMGSGWFDGKASNVQLYNSSLGANEIRTLYIDGIGAPPLELKNLVGWWPLNGDVSDYSGNGNSGVSNNIIFSEDWSNGYSIP
ncbi:MAG: LamG domain-containing protein [Candidatus Micrarchaeaceae archaeon]